jgi:hypothetical protein
VLNTSHFGLGESEKEHGIMRNFGIGSERQERRQGKIGVFFALVTLAVILLVFGFNSSAQETPPAPWTGGGKEFDCAAFGRYMAELRIQPNPTISVEDRALREVITIEQTACLLLAKLDEAIQAEGGTPDDDLTAQLVIYQLLWERAISEYYQSLVMAGEVRELQGVDSLGQVTTFQWISEWRRFYELMSRQGWATLESVEMPESSQITEIVQIVMPEGVGDYKNPVIQIQKMDFTHLDEQERSSFNIRLQTDGDSDWEEVTYFWNVWCDTPHGMTDLQGLIVLDFVGCAPASVSIYKRPHDDALLSQNTTWMIGGTRQFFFLQGWTAP